MERYQLDIKYWKGLFTLCDYTLQPAIPELSIYNLYTSPLYRNPQYSRFFTETGWREERGKPEVEGEGNETGSGGGGQGKKEAA